jgi:hypothetical protein
MNGKAVMDATCQKYTGKIKHKQGQSAEHPPRGKHMAYTGYKEIKANNCGLSDLNVIFSF